MNTVGTPRRTLLQRGLALLAGGVAIATGARAIRADTPIAPMPADKKDPRLLTLYTRHRPLAPPPATSRPAPAESSRQLTAGDLLDAPNGRRVGTVHTNCFCSGGPLGPFPSASDLEVQVLQLEGGTLFGMQGGQAVGGAKLRAIVGGTGRYAGARGVCAERPLTAHKDVVELIITLEA